MTEDRSGRFFRRGEGMKSLRISAYAKINLSLDVLGLTADGFHEVSMIMQQIRLHDDLLVRLYSGSEFLKTKKEEEKNETGQGRQQAVLCAPETGMQVCLSSNRPYLPRDERNLACRAAQLFVLRYKESAAVQKFFGGLIRIDIRKVIPVGAGLAGGSGNAAAVLHALNRLFGTELPLEELLRMAEELGSDVPFCVMGQARCNPGLDPAIRKSPLAASAAVASGRGTRLRPITGLRSPLVLVKPSFGVSTKEVYRGIDRELEEVGQKQKIIRPDNEALARGLRMRKRQLVTENMINLLEFYTLKAYPRVREIKEMMIQETDAEAVLMSGSGPTVFGIYPNRETASRAFQKMKKVEREVYLTETTR